MFKRLAPQRAQHNTGFIVQIGDRYSVQYIDGQTTAEVQADFGVLTGIYPDTLQLRKADCCQVQLNAEIHDLILNRIRTGLDFLDIPYELCEGEP